MTPTHKTKPQPVEAIQWTGRNAEQVRALMPSLKLNQAGDLSFPAYPNEAACQPGDWIVKRNDMWFFHTDGYFREHFDPALPEVVAVTVPRFRPGLADQFNCPVHFVCDQRSPVIFWYDREALILYLRGELQLSICPECGEETPGPGPCRPACPKPPAPDGCLPEDE